jgi:RNA-directed DNA polymerase
LPEKLFLLRQKLYLKAKREPKFKFYTLYGLMHRRDVLEAAWDRVADNDGAPGVDGIRVADVMNSPGGVPALLDELQDELHTKRYRPQRVKRTYIPKPDGRLRPLGIPTVRDRVAQTAATLILEAIFEADFLECSHGFRPGRSTEQALEEVRASLRAGRTAVYDADLQSYFDTIPHDKLEACLRMRIADRSVLKLIRLWLRAPVEEKPEQGGPPTIKRHRRGTPQGGVISPLLANVYLHWLDKLFHRYDGPRHWANARLIRYADDFVILARYVTGRLQGFVGEIVEDWLGLTINRTKTRVVRMTDAHASLDFLGYTFRYEDDLYGRRSKYLHAGPSKKALAKERAALRELISPRNCFMPLPALIQRVNDQLRSWSASFTWGYPRRAYRSINSYVRHRLARHLGRRSQRPFKPPKGVSKYAVFRRMGLRYL